MTSIKVKLLKLQKVLLEFKYYALRFNLLSKEKVQLASLLAFFVLTLSGFYGLGHFAFAQATDECQETAGCYGGTAADQYGGANLNIIASQFDGMVFGFTPQPQEGGGVAYVPYGSGRGAMGTLLATTGKMYLNRPAGTQQYMAYLMNKAEIGPSSAYAQDTVQGYTILQPIVKIWEWARNLVYIFYVVIFLVIGAMIILRQRIGGQVPITIINSIPNVILSLILVTFSYAISGLIMDLMHLAAGVIHAGLFTAGPGQGISGNFTFQSPDMSVFRIFGTADVTSFESSFDLPDIDVGEAGAGWLLNVLVNIVEGLSSWNVLVSTVLVIAAVAAMFKIFFTLLTEYLTFMIYPIVAPFQFLIGSLPGRGNLIWDWFKTMFGAVGAFVGVYAAFCVMIIISLAGSDQISDFQWYPPLTAFSTSSDVIRHLLSYAIFIATPKVPEIVKSMIQAPPASPLGGMVGGETARAVSRVPVIGGLLPS